MKVREGEGQEKEGRERRERDDIPYMQRSTVTPPI